MSNYRVTREMVEDKIKDVKYTILEDGKTTIANVYMQNGFTVRGESSCVDPKNFVKEKGEEIAFANAFNSAWAFEGYLMQQKQYEDQRASKTESNNPSYVQRMIAELHDLNEKIHKLKMFLNSEDAEKTVIALKLNLLNIQLSAMENYSAVLATRLAIECDEGNCSVEDIENGI